MESVCKVFYLPSKDKFYVRYFKGNEYTFKKHLYQIVSASLLKSGLLKKGSMLKGNKCSLYFNICPLITYQVLVVQESEQEVTNVVSLV